MTSEGKSASGLLLPTLFALVTLAVLIGLGTWQLQRKTWKEGLLAQIAARVTAPPVALAEALRRVRAGDDLEYTRVVVAGRWIPGREVLLWAPSTAGPGWHVLAPLATASGETVIVNRGFVPEARRDPKTRPEPAADRPVELVGLVRKPEIKALFTPDNDSARNIWYWRDLTGMARALQLDPSRTVPFVLDAERGAPTVPLGPQGGVTRLEIPNNHLQYVVTWYGLAATLVGVYAAFVRSRLQRNREPPVTAT